MISIRWIKFLNQMHGKRLGILQLADNGSHFVPSQNKAVNIEPLKSQTENHLDITETSFGRSEETNISDNSSHTRPQKPEVSITDEDFQNKYSLEKRPTTLDCLNRSLKGLSFNLEGEINVQLAVKVSKGISHYESINLLNYIKTFYVSSDIII